MPATQILLLPDERAEALLSLRDQLIGEPSHSLLCRWLQKAGIEDEGELSRDIRALLLHLLRSPACKDSLERALGLLKEISNEYTGTAAPALCDQEGGRANCLAGLRRLALSLSEKEKEVAIRVLGIWGHQLAAAVCNGLLPVGNPINPPKKRTVQLSLPLFEAEIADLPAPESDQPRLFQDPHYPDALLANGRLNPVHAERIMLHLDRLDSRMPRGKQKPADPRWQLEHYQAARDLLPELRHLLSPLAGSLVRRLRAPQGNWPAHYLIMVTLMSWARLIVFLSGSGPRHLFSEIALSSTESLGRIDGFQVIAIAGRKPAEREEEILCQLACQRYRSLSEAAETLVRHFGPKIQIRIWDWKFMAGDAPHHKRLITLSEVRKGIAKHRDQMERYLAVGHDRLYDILDTPGLRKGRWFSGSPLTDVKMVYVFDRRAPVIRAVTCDVRRKRQAVYKQLRKDIASLKVQENADLRLFSNFVAGAIRRMLKPEPLFAQPSLLPDQVPLALEWELPVGEDQVSQ